MSVDWFCFDVLEMNIENGGSLMKEWARAEAHLAPFNNFGSSHDSAFHGGNQFGPVWLLFSDSAVADFQKERLGCAFTKLGSNVINHVVSPVWLDFAVAVSGSLYR